LVGLLRLPLYTCRNGSIVGEKTRIEPLKMANLRCFQRFVLFDEFETGIKNTEVVTGKYGGIF
jgi:hypothetical protein